MITTYVEYVFELENGATKKITIKDVKEDVTNNELTAISDLLIQKSSQFNGIIISKLKQCNKFNVEKQQII